MALRRASSVPATPRRASWRLAEELGARLVDARRDGRVGGLGGVMEAACRGAKSRRGRRSGCCPGETAPRPTAGSTWRSPTGLGELRNGLIVRTSDALVAIGGGAGTLSEIGFALKLGRPVIGLGTFDARRRRAGAAAAEAAALARALNRHLPGASCDGAAPSVGACPRYPLTARGLRRAGGRHRAARGALRAAAGGRRRPPARRAQADAVEVTRAARRAWCTSPEPCGSPGVYTLGAGRARAGRRPARRSAPPQRRPRAPSTSRRSGRRPADRRAARAPRAAPWPQRPARGRVGAQRAGQPQQRDARAARHARRRRARDRAEDPRLPQRARRLSLGRRPGERSGHRAEEVRGDEAARPALSAAARHPRHAVLGALVLGMLRRAPPRRRSLLAACALGRRRHGGARGRCCWPPRSRARWSRRRAARSSITRRAAAGARRSATRRVRCSTRRARRRSAAGARRVRAARRARARDAAGAGSRAARRGDRRELPSRGTPEAAGAGAGVDRARATSMPPLAARRASGDRRARAAASPAFVDGIRRRAERALDAGAPRSVGGLLRGMVLGEGEALDRADAATTSGAASLTHLVAASGQNVALLAALAVALGDGAGPRAAGAAGAGARAGRPVRPAGRRRPSIQRAGIMGGAALVAALGGRPASRAYALLLAAALTLLAQPARGRRTRAGSSASRRSSASRSGRPRARRRCARGACPRAVAEATRDDGRRDARDGAADRAALRAGLARRPAGQHPGGARRRARDVARRARGRGRAAERAARGAVGRARGAAGRVPRVARPHVAARARAPLSSCRLGVAARVRRGLRPVRRRAGGRRVPRAGARRAGPPSLALVAAVAVGGRAASARAAAPPAGPARSRSSTSARATRR